MKREYIVIGLIILVLIAGGLYFRKPKTSSTDDSDSTQTSAPANIENKIEEKFKVDIPDDADKIEMEDATGGDASGIAVRKYEKNVFDASILADLPEPEKGKIYYAWISKGEEGKEGFERVLLGSLQIAKGGWSLEYTGSKDYSDYDTFLVSEGKTSDNKPDKVVLQSK